LGIILVPREGTKLATPEYGHSTPQEKNLKMLHRSSYFSVITTLVAITLTFTIPTLIPKQAIAQTSPGDLDTSFDGDGLVTTSVSGTGDKGRAVAIQSDGKILVAGEDGNKNITVVRYNSDGSLDTTFDGDGIVTTTISGNDKGNGIAIQADGKILVAGSTRDAGGNDNFLLLRYNPNGGLDTTFDGDGIAFTSLGTAKDQAWDVAIQSDGKIIVVGKADVDIGVVRFNTNGSLDTTFDGDGIAVTDLGSGKDEARAVALQSDGKIVVGGNTDVDFALVRYNANGSLDTGFGTGGSVVTDLGSAKDRGG